MKQLFIIRHAKSDQRFFGNDFERPLNERGVRDAISMSKRLKEKTPGIDAFVSSPAFRAKKTAEIFAETYGILTNEITFISSLYHAPVDTIYEEITRFSKKINAVSVFTHNPGVTFFVNTLISGIRIDNMPTCAIFGVVIHTTDWTNIVKAQKEFLFFDYPKLSI